MTPSDRVQALESLLQRVQQNAQARPQRHQNAQAPPSQGHAPVAAPPPRAAAPSTWPPPSDGVLELSDDDGRQDEPTIPPPGSASPPPRQALPLTSLDDDEVTAVRPAYTDDDAPRISMGSESEILLDVDFDDVHLIDEPTISADADAAIAREQARAEAAREAKAAEARKASEATAAREAAQAEAAKAAAAEATKKAVQAEAARADEAEATKKAAEAEAAKQAAEVEEAAPISARQARPKDEVREMDFDDLGGEEEEQPPESGEVASQRKPTVDPTLTALADWHEEETEDGPEPEPVVARGTEPPPTVQGGSAEVRLHAPSVDADVEPQVIRRSGSASVDVMAFVDAAQAPAADSFGALLDASLSLGS